MGGLRMRSVLHTATQYYLRNRQRDLSYELAIYLYSCLLMRWSFREGVRVT